MPTLIAFINRSDNGNIDHFLKPFDLGLIAKRNLSAVYDIHPMVSVNLKFSSLQVCKKVIILNE